MHGFSVDVGDQIPSLQSCLASWTSFFYIPNNMMHCVDVTVPDVHPDGSDGEAVVLPQTMDHNGLVWAGGSARRIPAGRGIP